MIKKICLAGYILVIVMLIGFSVKTGSSANDKMLKVECAPLYDAPGWGYDILVDHKIFIHQQYIPGIIGKKAFLTKEDAMKTAGLVAEKLVRGKQPSISKGELALLKISLP